MARVLHAVVVRRTEVYRLMVETNSSAPRYERRDAETAAVERVKSAVHRMPGEAMPPTVERLGETYDAELLMSTSLEVEVS